MPSIVAKFAWIPVSSAWLMACSSAAPPRHEVESASPVAPTRPAPPTPSSEARAVSEAPPPSASPGSDVSAPPQTNKAISAEPEILPSGLAVDTRIVGGPAPGPDLPRGTRVLHVGDSFAGALGIELNKVFAAAGVKGRLEFEKSTYIPTWAHSSKLASMMSTFKPDLVLVSLGANELENPEPEKRAALIRKLVQSLGDTPCVWVAPVLWEGAKAALLDVIRANVGSCLYLDSNAMVLRMPRAGDKIHPSMAARPDWAAVTARWLAYHRKPSDQRPWKLAESSP